MGRKNQIEKMARTMCGEKEHTCEECDSSDMCEFWTEASRLYNAGYRKQSEDEWESYYDGYRCPCCKEVFKSDMLFIMESFPEGKLPGCCPNCGAKMKGGESLERKTALGSGAEEK